MDLDTARAFLEVVAQISTFIIALVALYISWDTAKATRKQAEQTENALKQEQNFSRASTVIHFTNSFFSLIGKDERPISQKLQDDDWRIYYWGLLSTEFYFFHYDVLPSRMFALWMVDLADAYSSFDTLWKSHEHYLDQYCILYPEMKDFFSSIHEDSKIDSRDSRHRKVKETITNWVNENVEKEFS